MPRLQPDIVTFWHGPLDALRRLCLRSQVAAGHKVTVYSFEPLPQLPDGVGNAEADAILPYAFAERLRPTGSDPKRHDWTMPQFSDFFRMRLMAKNMGENAGLWLDADVLLLKAVEIDSTKPYFAWEQPRQLGNSVLYLPAHDPIVAAFVSLMQQDELTPDWLSLRHRLLHRLRGSRRVSDLRVAIFGPAALTALARRSDELHYALPKKSFYAVHAEPRLFFEPRDFSADIGDTGIIGFHISPKRRGNQSPAPGSLHAWAAKRFGA
jgi:hypothetical protein